MPAAIGLEELVALDKAQYVLAAVELAYDPARLKRIRRRLRVDMATSPLCDAQGMAAALEDAYADMWRQYLNA